MSNTSDPAAKLYAQALMQVAQDRGELGSVHAEMHEVQALYDGDAWFRQFFTSPRLDREVKWRALSVAFEGKVSRPVLGLLHVLVARGRELLLDNVVAQFDRFKDLAENRIHAHVVVARELDARQVAELVARLEAASGKDVALHQRVDPAALGGASIRVGDKIIDRTLRTRLAALRRQLTGAAGAARRQGDRDT